MTSGIGCDFSSTTVSITVVSSGDEGVGVSVGGGGVRDSDGAGCGGEEAEEGNECCDLHFVMGLGLVDERETFGIRLVSLLLFVWRCV